MGSISLRPVANKTIEVDGKKLTISAGFVLAIFGNVWQFLDDRDKDAREREAKIIDQLHEISINSRETATTVKHIKESHGRSIANLEDGFSDIRGEVQALHSRVGSNNR